MKKIFSWILVFAVFMQLLIPIGVQAANEDYFVINTLEASPGEPIQIRYHLTGISGENYTLYLKNRNGTVYQSWNLTCQPNSPYIIGYHQFAAPSDIGQYEFQLYGRFTEETFSLLESAKIFTDITIAVAKITDHTFITLSYFELNDFIVDVFEGPLTDLANFIGLGEEPVVTFMLF